MLTSNYSNFPIPLLWSYFNTKCKLRIMFELLEGPLFPESSIVTMGLYLPAPEEQAAVLLSQSICSERDCSFVLDRRNNPPRVRLYESVFPNYEINKIKVLLQHLCHQMVAFPVSWDMIVTFDRFLAIWVKLNEPLSLFQRVVLTEISPLRHGYYKQKYTTKQSQLTQEEQQSLTKWGSPWAEPYNPHMIIAKTLDRAINQLPSIDWKFHHSILEGLVIEIKVNHKINSVTKIPFAKHV